MILFRNDPWIRLVDEFFDSTTKPTQSGYVNVNKKENEDKYELQFLVPGLNKNDIDIVVEEDTLKVKYEKPEDVEGFVNSFERTYSLPEDVDDKKIDAKVKDGILYLNIPKVKKKTKQRTISVS
jgi:HSP20 family protein